MSRWTILGEASGPNWRRSCGRSGGSREQEGVVRAVIASSPTTGPRRTRKCRISIYICSAAATSVRCCVAPADRARRDPAQGGPLGGRNRPVHRPAGARAAQLSVAITPRAADQTAPSRSSLISCSRPCSSAPISASARSQCSTDLSSGQPDFSRRSRRPARVPAVRATSLSFHSPIASNSLSRCMLFSVVFPFAEIGQRIIGTQSALAVPVCFLAGFAQRSCRTAPKRDDPHCDPPHLFLRGGLISAGRSGFRP